MSHGFYKQSLERFGPYGMAIDGYSFMVKDGDDLILTYNNKCGVRVRPDDTATLHLPQGGWGQWATWVRHIGHRFGIRAVERKRTVGKGIVYCLAVDDGPAVQIMMLGQNYIRTHQPTKVIEYTEDQIECKPLNGPIYSGLWELAPPATVTKKVVDKKKAAALIARIKREWTVHEGSYRLTGDDKNPYYNRWQSQRTNDVDTRPRKAKALLDGLTYEQFKALKPRSSCEAVINSCRIELYELGGCYL